MTMTFSTSLMCSETPTASLAQWCHDLAAQGVAETVLEETSRHVLDTLAACAAGMSRPLVQAMIDFERSLNVAQGTVPLFGGPQRWTVPEAASLMAIAAHALEMDDGNREGSIHPGTVIVPAVFALGWVQQCDYQSLLLAVTAGYEFAVSIAETLHPHASQRGFQTTPVAGPIGAAAACAVLLKLDAKQIERAMGIAASASSGIFAYLHGGGNIKKIHPGHAAREGVRAALMAQQGSVLGPLGVLEAPSGVLQAFGGVAPWQIDKARAREDFAVARSYLKPYPCCRHIHPAVDAILSLQTSQDWAVDAVRSIRVETYGAAMPHARLPWDSLEIAQLSFPWVMALACVRGEVRLDGFSEASRQCPTINKVAKQVDVVQTEACDRLYPNASPARVIVGFEDGRRVEAYAENALGSYELPLSDEALDHKALEGLNQTFSSDASHALLNLLRTTTDWPLQTLVPYLRS